MDKSQIKITIFYDGQFWTGVFERIIDNKVEVAKHIFGKEPTEPELYNFIRDNYDLLKFSKPTCIDIDNKKLNPKRMKREVNKQMSEKVGKKSWDALKQLQEENKIERKKRSKEQKEQEQHLKYELKKEKKHEKHRGR